jgi:4-hydroxythreonine-4-phosphate dehydrogenase
MKPRIAITIGDPAGIGPEVVSAAVCDPQVHRVCEPIVVGDPVAFALHELDLPAAEMLSTPGLNKRLRLGRPTREGGCAAIEALQAGHQFVQNGQAAALVTAPVSKEAFALADYGFPGHTEWLARQCGVKKVGMLMTAGELRTLLMTRHIPLRDVSRTLTIKVVVESAELANEFVARRLHRAKPTIVLCGLNPHAGDNGLLGREEIRILKPALKALERRGIFVTGPLAADAAFRELAKGRFDLALACYHDQGMIPLKVHASERMVNITLGLPYVRTSPAHGTAYDIAGKKTADPRPMIEAILLAAQYSR